MLERGHVNGPEILLFSVSGLEGAEERVFPERVFCFGPENIGAMVFVFTIGGGEVDVPFTLKEVEFRCPDLLRVGAGFRGGPDGVFLTKGA